MSSRELLFGRPAPRYRNRAAPCATCPSGLDDRADLIDTQAQIGLMAQQHGLRMRNRSRRPRGIRGNLGGSAYYGPAL